MDATANFSVSGMHCGSCGITIKRALTKMAGVRSVDIGEGAEQVSVVYDAAETNPEALAHAIAAKGYGVSAPGIYAKPPRVPLAQRARAFISEPAFASERAAVETGLFSLILLSVINLFLFQALFPLGVLAILTLYLIITVSAVGATLWHFFSFRRQVPCMSGMMAGMVIGMIAGFLTGVIVTAANGIFIGTVYGMAAGMLIGALAGRCCGIMGLLEGMMAGLMSGVMGGMVPLMFLSENVLLFLPILTGACVLILLGLGYSTSWEVREYEKAQGPIPRKPFGFVPFISLAFLIIFSTTALMAWGPKGALTLVGG